jgi:hypothetical protein
MRNNNVAQHRVKKIAGKSQFMKVIADFLVGFYLQIAVPKTRNFPYTTTLWLIKKKYLEFNNLTQQI